MTRPRKQNVDYFPHYCKHGKVLFVLESKYGNDGYAFFYKLLEALGDADGHFIDCSKPAQLEYLTAVSGAKTPQSVTDILNTLATLSIIDQKLWSSRVIWMQSFVDSVADVYRKRSQSAPVMPLLTPETPIPAPETPRQPPENPQRIVKDSKGKERISKKQKTPLPENFNISPSVQAWAKKKGHTQLDEHLESFTAKCRANGYQYIDWDSAFMEAIRADWAKLKPYGGNGKGKSTGRAHPESSSYKTCPKCGEEYQETDMIEIRGVKCCPKCPEAREESGRLAKDGYGKVLEEIAQRSRASP